MKERITAEAIAGLRVDELQKIRDYLLSQREEIETQLAIPRSNYLTADGQAVTDEEYADWRRRASYAKTKIGGQQRIVNAALKAARVEEHNRLAAAKSAAADARRAAKASTNFKPMLKGLLAIIDGADDAGVEIFPEERALIAEAKGLIAYWEEKERHQVTA